MSQSDQSSVNNFDSIYRYDKGAEHLLDMNFQERKGAARLFMTDEFTVIDTNYTSATGSAKWSHYNDRPFVELNFVLSGNLYQSHSGLMEQQLYTSGYHNCLFSPDSLEENELTSGREFHSVSLQIEPGRMINLLLDYAPELEVYAQKIEKGMPFVSQSALLNLPAHIKYLLKILWQGPANPGLKRLHFESVVLQLLCYQYEQLLHTEQDVPVDLKPGDRDKLVQARTLLLEQLSDPPNLATLARDCQLNAFSLKKGFKQLFGTTVFGFVLQQRMEAARNSIYSGEKTISEIAYELGYAHPQHFHRVFKKYYGITPKEMNK